jgi:hypothetical protein
MSDLELTANYAHQLDTKIKELKRAINYSFLSVGYYLHEIKDKKLYELLDYESFNAYISQPELSFKRATAYKLVGIYETFVLELKVSQDRLLEIDYGKLDMIRTSSNKDNVEELLVKAESLSRSDLLAEVEGKELYQIKKYCPFCGKEVEHLVTKVIDN